MTDITLYQNAIKIVTEVIIAIKHKEKEMKLTYKLCFCFWRVGDYHNTK